MAEQTPATATVSCATVQIGTRSFTIDPSPLPRANPWDGQRRTVELNQLSVDCLLLEPKKWWLLWHMLLILGICAGASAGLLYLLLDGLGNGDWAEIVIASIGFLVMFVLFLLGLSAPGGFKRWIRFNRAAGSLKISRRPFGFRRPLRVIASRPLTDVVCIQLLYEAFQHEIIEIGERGTPGSAIYRKYHSYQLNVVFDDPKEPRYNLATHSDLQWMREAGQKLAEFLRIPVLDQVNNNAPHQR